jgi:hypothetical protein
LLARFAIRLRGDRAGVEYHDIGLGGIGGYLMSALHELAGPGLQFGFVEPATERLKINKHVCITLKKVRGF